MLSILGNEAAGEDLKCEKGWEGDCGGRGGAELAAWCCQVKKSMCSKKGQGDVKDITGIAQRTLSSSMGFAERLSQRLLWHTVGQ